MTIYLLVDGAERRQRFMRELQDYLAEDGRVYGAEQHDGTGVLQEVLIDVHAAENDADAIERIQPFTMRWPEREHIVGGTTAITLLVPPPAMR